MGHERLGILPKTKAWRLIIEELAGFANGEADSIDIAKNTLLNVRKQFDKLENDPSIQASFEFLLQLSYSFQKENPLKYLKENRILDKEELSLIKIGLAVYNFKPDEATSSEYQTFARQSAIDAINNWYADNIGKGQTLFSDKADANEIFLKTSNGSGFCELSRLFFSKFTERYLKYFLEREASAVISNIKERNRFNEEIENHIRDISIHAFETAKITQSFAAGWYNNNVKDSFPEDYKIKGFLSYAMKKMKSELLQEESK